DGLYIAAGPTVILGGDASNTFFQHARRGGRPRRAKCKHGAWNIRQRRVVPAALGATGHLPVNVLIALAVGFDQAAEDVAPLLYGVRVVHADLIQTPREAFPVRRETKWAAIIDGHDLI